MSLSAIRRSAAHGQILAIDYGFPERHFTLWLVRFPATSDTRRTQSRPVKQNFSSFSTPHKQRICSPSSKPTHLDKNAQAQQAVWLVEFFRGRIPGKPPCSAQDGRRKASSSPLMLFAI